MKFRLARGAEVVRLQIISCAHEGVETFVRIETREGEMRRVFARFRRKTQRLERCVNGSGQGDKIRGAFHSAPNHTWVKLVGEESEAAKIQIHGPVRMYERKRGLNRIEFCSVRFAQKFQGDMHASRPNPARIGAFGFQPRYQFAKRAAHCIGNIERDEETHGLGASKRGVEEISANGVERLLRGLKAYAFGGARETSGALGGAAFVGDADVHQAYRLFWSSPARTSDAGDANAECGAGTFPNAVG